MNSRTLRPRPARLTLPHGQRVRPVTPVTGRRPHSLPPPRADPPTRRRTTPPASLDPDVDIRIRSEVEAPFRAVRLVLFSFFAVSASVGALIATTQTIAAATGRGNLLLPDVATSLVIDLLAAGVFAFLVRKDLDARAKQVARLEREAALGGLRIITANGRALRLRDLRGTVRPVVVAGTRAQVDAALAAAEAVKEELTARGVIIVAAPVFGDSSSTPPLRPAPDDLRFIVTPDERATPAFRKWFTDQAAAAGATTERGLYVGLRIDGRVRASGTGTPPFAAFAKQLPTLEWAGFLDGFDGRIGER